MSTENAIRISDLLGNHDPLTEPGLGDPELWFGFRDLSQDQEFKDRRRRAADDLVCMVPRQCGRLRMFRKTKPCLDLNDYIVATQMLSLQSWLAPLNREVSEGCPAHKIIRLDEGWELDVVDIRRMGNIAVPLFSQEKDVTIVTEDGRSLTRKWTPDSMLYFAGVTLRAVSRTTLLLIQFSVPKTDGTNWMSFAIYVPEADRLRQALATKRLRETFGMAT